MEKNIFDKQFVYFMWDDSLKGKECFVADEIDLLEQRVENNAIDSFYTVKSHSTSFHYPFCVDLSKQNDEYDNTADYRFVYYDPLYDVKWAWKNGEKIQYKNAKSMYQWIDCMVPSWREDTEYRIKSKSSRMTYRELSEWLAKGHGQYRAGSEVTMSYPFFVYAFEDDTAEVSEDYLVRRWGSDAWIKPTIEVYEQDCKKE